MGHKVKVDRFVKQLMDVEHKYDAKSIILLNMCIAAML